MKVLVTGATGFIAGHCIEELLRNGYAVRGTVRSLGATARVAHLRAIADELGGELQFVEGDLTSSDGWDDAVAGCQKVLHTASPLPLEQPDDPDEVIGPAVSGVRHVLSACARAGVERVVLTSSFAAVYQTDRPEGHVWSADDWSDPERGSPYLMSKTRAELAAWALVDELPEEERFELAVVNPTLVLGPLQAPRANTSIEPLRRLVAREMPALPHLGFGVVDVRDVARAHRLAMEVPEAAGERFVLSTEFLWLRDMAGILREAGYRVPRWPLPTVVLRAMSVFDKSLRQVLPDVGKRMDSDIGKTREVLGWTPRDVADTVRDTARSLVEQGLVQAR